MDAMYCWNKAREAENNDHRSLTLLCLLVCLMAAKQEDRKGLANQAELAYGRVEAGGRI